MLASDLIEGTPAITQGQVTCVITLAALHAAYGGGDPALLMERNRDEIVRVLRRVIADGFAANGEVQIDAEAFLAYLALVRHG